MPINLILGLVLISISLLIGNNKEVFAVARA